MDSRLTLTTATRFCRTWRSRPEPTLLADMAVLTEPKEHRRSEEQEPASREVEQTELFRLLHKRHY